MSDEAHLIIQGPGHDHSHLPIREGITSFGRLPSNDVILLGDLVSRHHARIIYFDGKASIQDLGSHNGSWVNGERVSTRGLGEGDVVRIGNFAITFKKGPMEGLFVGEATADQPSLDPGPVAHPRAPTAIPRPVSATQEEPEELPENLASRRSGQSKLVEEIDEVRRAAGRPETSAEALHLLYKVTEALVKATEVSEYLDQILLFCLERLRAEHAIYFHVLPGQPDPERMVERSSAGDGPAPVSMSVVRWTISKTFTVFSRDVAADLRFKQGGSVAFLPESARSLVCAPVAAHGRVFGALYLTRPLEQAFDEAEVDTIEAICHLAAAGVGHLELRGRAVEDGLAREALARFHSPDVVERILSEAEFGKEPVLENRPVSVCFCDVRGFTRFASESDIGFVSAFLNHYVEAMSGVVFAHKGTINKLLGDGIVALFGAPFSYGNDAARAVSAALDMQAAFDRTLERFDQPLPLKLRIGINTGDVLTGTIGSARQMEYTVIGETVNLAARIQAAAPPGSILISHTTRRSIPDNFVTKKLGARQIRGHVEPLEIYEVLGRRSSEADTAH